MPNVNGSVRRPVTTIPSSLIGSITRPNSLLDSPNHSNVQYQIKRVEVMKDDKGYGMKVSGDNPVFVQSVKPGKKFIKFKHSSCIYRLESK